MRTARLLTTISLLSLCAAIYSASPDWEVVRTADTTELSDPDRIEVKVHNGYIYITTAHAATVKVLSIVGQTISQHNIPAGTSRIHMPARGIYIVKIGGVTRRVVI